MKKILEFLGRFGFIIFNAVLIIVIALIALKD